MNKIYVAGPYTLGDIGINVKNSLDAANELMDAGFCPFVPLLSHFWHIVHPRPYADWINYDIEWLYACDAVLRLPGASSGADNEAKLAELHDIPVFYSIEDLMSAEI